MACIHFCAIQNCKSTKANSSIQKCRINTNILFMIQVRSLIQKLNKKKGKEIKQIELDLI